MHRSYRPAGTSKIFNFFLLITIKCLSKPTEQYDAVMYLFPCFPSCGDILFFSIFFVSEEIRPSWIFSWPYNITHQCKFRAHHGIQGPPRNLRQRNISSTFVLLKRYFLWNWGCLCWWNKMNCPQNGVYTRLWKECQSVFLPHMYVSGAKVGIYSTRHTDIMPNDITPNNINPNNINPNDTISNDISSNAT